ncbi:hypothetical protein NDU88_004872 [Pleurodeles waltl]|uniref:Uncharacterized protein n=1 Tax=Pleurodeles waltl TaxID=8319 RepID=A0AAV7UGD1_PLEWA|nr:hypothetical protein NDU88_004872 [Pleurodeles waltl]
MLKLRHPRWGSSGGVAVWQPPDSLVAWPPDEACAGAREDPDRRCQMCTGRHRMGPLGGGGSDQPLPFSPSALMSVGPPKRDGSVAVPPWRLQQRVRI